jgi:hypothetical protein
VKFRVNSLQIIHRDYEFSIHLANPLLTHLNNSRDITPNRVTNSILDEVNEEYGHNCQQL